MRIHWTAAALTVGTLAVALGCGNYNAPNNTRTSPDSGSSDSMAPPPSPGPGYLRN